MQGLLVAQSAVEGNAEPVRLVPDAHQVQQGRGVSGQQDRIFSARPEQFFPLFLFFLGNGYHVDTIQQVKLGKYMNRNVELSLATVEQQHVRQVFFNKPGFHPPAQHLVHHCIVVRFIF